MTHKIIIPLPARQNGLLLKDRPPLIEHGAHERNKFITMAKTEIKSTMNIENLSLEKRPSTGSPAIAIRMLFNTMFTPNGQRIHRISRCDRLIRVMNIIVITR